MALPHRVGRAMAKKHAPRAFPGLTHRNRARQRAFLVAFTKTGTVTRAAKAARVERRTHTNWLKDDAYAEAFEDAKEMAADYLEDEARRRALKGLVRYRFSKDGTPLTHPVTKKPYYELEYSDHLLVALLKGNRPSKFRDRVEHTGKDGGPIETNVTTRWDLSKLSDAELDALAQLQAKAAQS